MAADADLGGGPYTDAGAAAAAAAAAATTAGGGGAADCSSAVDWVAPIWSGKKGGHTQNTLGFYRLLSNGRSTPHLRCMCYHGCCNVSGGRRSSSENGLLAVSLVRSWYRSSVKTPSALVLFPYAGLGDGNGEVQHQ